MIDPEHRTVARILLALILILITIVCALLVYTGTIRLGWGSEHPAPQRTPHQTTNWT